MTSFLSSGNVSKDIESLNDEYDDSIEEAEKLCNINDPESNPYDSKYKARERLEAIRRKIEACSVIVQVESNDVYLLRQLRLKMASIDVRLGSIAYDVEEPHICERELTTASQCFYPDFLHHINISCKRIEDEVDVIETDHDHHKVDKQDESYDADTWKPPVLNVASDVNVLDAMKCLNMMGILWSGRAQMKKSLMFLLAAKQLYHQYTSSHPSSSQSSLSYDNMKLSTSQRSSFESLYTHNLFYLAQCYGHIHELKLSCIYCQETLRRQYMSGFATVNQAYEWCKNCMNISDFYLSMRYYHHAHISLSTAKHVLSHHNMKHHDDKDDDMKEMMVELDADISRRQAKIDECIMQRCYERDTIISNIRYNHTSSSSSSDDVDDDIKSIYDEYHQQEVLEDTFEQELHDAISSTSSSSSSTTSSTSSSPSSTSSSYQFIPGVDVPVLACIKVSDIRSFDEARQVFLRGAANIEYAKKHYVLDGYVTDHVMLLQCQSKLYHYLTIYETQPKRIIAMESRRIDLLEPIIYHINKTVYDALHKEISYEVGETYLSLLDTKLEKFRLRSSSSSSSSSHSVSYEWNIDVSSLKAAEVERCNHYCRGALAMFAHFTRLYSSIYTAEKGEVDNSIPSIKWPLNKLIHASCESPRIDTITSDEIRPYLNAHFLYARTLSKLIISSSSPSSSSSSSPSSYVHPVEPIEACMMKYLWMMKFVPMIAEVKDVEVHMIPYHEELKICQEMASLLPSKIYRMKTQGEVGFRL